ncbi:MAG: glycosyltransferase [Saprospiraceae bacterium]|nr:glycosyltransferase [Saprospiraceae bacterium]
MIPRKFHFCRFKAPASRGGKPFVYANYLCLYSVIKLHPGAEFNFYYNEEIQSPWFDLLKPYLNLIKVTAPTEIFGITIKRVEHQADIFRLRILLKEGGIYLDTDVFLIKKLDDLLGHNFVMGIENGMGLCNGVILSEKESVFVQTWYDSYHPDCTKEGAGFKPDGWGEMSVRFPELLAKNFKEYTTILPVTAFFQPSGSPKGMKILFDSEVYWCDESYGNHLWESQSWDWYLKDMQPADVIEKKGYFYKLVKQHFSENEILGRV